MFITSTGAGCQNGNFDIASGRPFINGSLVMLILTCLFQWNAPVDDDEDVRDPRGRLGHNVLSRTPVVLDVVVPVEHADDDEDGSM